MLKIPSDRAARFPVKACLMLTGIAVLAVAIFERVPSADAYRLEVDGTTTCACRHIKAIQAELHNALKLQEAFRNKVSELRQMNQPTSNNALQTFAKSEARQGLETVPDYDGPKEVDYDNNGSSLNDPLHPGRTFNAEQLCQKTDSANATLNLAIAKSACAGIGAALRAHEAVHEKSCLAQGFVNYFSLHGADRAQEEVEAYGAQIKVLREILASLVCGYRATGQTADTKYSGVICSLEKPFTVTGTNAAMTYPFMFDPQSATNGRVGFQATTSLPISASGSGTYRIEGDAPESLHIVMTMGSVGVTPVGTRSGGGSVRIDLVPLESGECEPKP
jgi:hypothetical protein